MCSVQEVNAETPPEPLCTLPLRLGMVAGLCSSPSQSQNESPLKQRITLIPEKQNLTQSR